MAGAVKQGSVGMVVGRLHEFFDRVGFNPVVGVQKEDHFAGSKGDAGVSCRRHPRVFLMNDLDPRKQGLNDLTGLVRGTVVNDDDLKAGVGLGEKRPDGLV